MSRRTIAKLSLALILVLIGTLSTVRVRQAWGEQQAKSSFDSGRQQVALALKRASHAGLFTRELAPYSERVRQLNGVAQPSSSLFWGSREAFYDRQAAAYRALAHRIDSEIGVVTARTKSRAESDLVVLQRAVDRARSYDIDTAAAQSFLAHNRTLLSHSSTPRGFRSISTSTGVSLASLNASTNVRARYVSSTLASTGNSAAGMQSAADNETATARSQLSMIGLFTARASSFGAELTSADSTVHAQSTAFKAAVKESALHDLTARIAALYSKTLPNKLIVVSTEDQWARMYENGAQVYDTPVTTGGPELPTDRGVFHIYDKISPFVFHSPWPEGSPYYYPPTPIDFWMPFDGAEGLHDASWRSNFGPGSNFAPTDLGTGNYILGTHGCVNLPYDAASYVWNWAPVGTTVVVT